jgi:hypothetical protein
LEIQVNFTVLISSCFPIYSTDIQVAIFLGVGKSCIVSRATKNEFRPMHKVTIGVEFGSYLTEIEGKKIKLSIWDTV